MNEKRSIGEVLEDWASSFIKFVRTYPLLSLVVSFALGGAVF